jgi:glycosyltransferase involved in cell wall biosynthesis
MRNLGVGRTRTPLGAQQEPAWLPGYGLGWIAYRPPAHAPLTPARDQGDPCPRTSSGTPPAGRGSIVAQVEPYTPREFSDLRVAIVHDWLTVYGGAERVLEQLINILPHADLFSIIDFLPQASRGFLRGKSVRTSFVQGLPFVRGKYRNYLSLMPLAVEQFDLTNYDLVVSSSHAVAKGIITGPDQLHISYVHSPVRYAWDLQHEYFAQAGMDNGVKAWLARWMMHRVRMWDIRTANGVDHFVANSGFIRRRIWKIYRRDAIVIYPPVDVRKFGLYTDKHDFYMTASRIVPYKRVDVIVKAFGYLRDKRLIVIGDGPEMQNIRNIKSDNVSILGHLNDEDLRYYMQRARAFLFAAQEDFGIAPVEAQACGTPVIAYGSGGVTESVRGLDMERPTGVFFTEPTVESLIAAIGLFEKHRGRIAPAACRDNAARFAPDRFRREFSGFLRHQLSALSDSRESARHAVLYGRAVGEAGD